MKQKSIFCALMLLCAAAFSAWAQTLILPITGVSADEAKTIVTFIAMTRNLTNFVDQSANAALAPKGGRVWGVGYENRAAIGSLMQQNGAAQAIGINVSPYGAGKLATIRDFDSNGNFTGGSDIQYADPFEFWIKLQNPPATERRAGGGKVWVEYKSGVNRADAEEMVHLLMSDLVSMGSQGIGNLDDQTPAYEAAMAQLQGREEIRSRQFGTITNPGGDWTGRVEQYARNRFSNVKLEKKDRDPFYEVTWGSASDQIFDALGRVSGGVTMSAPYLYFIASRQGGRTRIEIFRMERMESSAAAGSFIVEAATVQEFRRSLRATSLRLMDALFKETVERVYAAEAARAGWMSNSALTELRTNVPVPNTMVQIKRAPASPGEIPRGGFYIGMNPVTQREFEAVMGSNPSATKGANLPVRNVTLVEAMEYCNRLSLREGLMPVYDYFYWQGIPERYERTGVSTFTGKTETVTETRYYGTRLILRSNEYANGYRLPTRDEWSYVEVVSLAEIIPSLKGGEFVIAEYVLGAPSIDVKVDIYTRTRDMANMPLAAPVAGAGTGEASNVSYETVRMNGKDVQVRVLSMQQDTNQVPTWTSRVSDDGKIIPGFRVVRPVFDYWAYRSSEK